MGALRRLNSPASLSILLHLLLMMTWFWCAQIAPSLTQAKHTQPIIIEVEPLPATSSDQSKRVVMTEKGHITKEADPKALLGEHNQLVDRQTVSQQKMGDAIRAAIAKPKVTQQENAQKKGGSVIPTLSQLGIALPKPGMKPGESDTNTEAQEAGALNAQVQGDYVKGYKESDQTMLNTREFVFFGYFQRIRSSLDRAWEKSLRDKLTKYFYRGRSLASEMDYTTKLLVTLSNDGQVVRVQMLGASGAKDLDEAAIRAFNEAGPFPNPPKGLIDTTGKVLVRWDFVLKT